MSVIHVQYYKNSDTEFIIGAYEDKLCLLDYRYRKMREQIDKRLQKGLNAEYLFEDTATLQRARLELDEYFSLQRSSFDIPLLMVGSDFQKSVWEGLLRVPYGKTASYLELAKDIGNEKAVRAVANANGANAISIMIPCHRIIGSNGKLTGYAGGLALKKRLLDLEQNLFIS